MRARVINDPCHSLALVYDSGCVLSPHICLNHYPFPVCVVSQVLMDNYLPMGSLEMGLDVLQIMRNIHIFVSRFTYNMNMQQFVEYRPDKSSKHLNTIKIQSIAASIRQHGLGVLNTTVNFTYQFLSSKFHIFSQFLFDDYIRAHLSREHRWFKKHKNEPEVNSMYPYDRALKFVKDIRKLGVNEAGKSFLDQFRILITEIGE
jgi:WASH complex subunit 7